MLKAPENRMMNVYVTKKTRQKKIGNVRKLISVGVAPQTAFQMCGFTDGEARAFGLADMCEWERLACLARQQIAAAETGIQDREGDDMAIDVRVTVADDGIIRKNIEETVLSIIAHEEKASVYEAG